MIWTDDSEDWEIPTLTTYDAVISSVAGFIAAGNAVILLEHDLNNNTVTAGQEISQMISNAGGRTNCPIAAVFGDPQRYQGTKLTWPVVGSNGFTPSSNPISGTTGRYILSRLDFNRLVLL